MKSNKIIRVFAVVLLLLFTSCSVEPEYITETITVYKEETIAYVRYAKSKWEEIEEHTFKSALYGKEQTVYIGMSNGVVGDYVLSEKQKADKYVLSSSVVYYRIYTNKS